MDMTASAKRRFVLSNLVCLLGLMPFAGVSVWQTWRGFEAYFLTNHSSQIDAKIITIDPKKGFIAGTINFQYDKNGLNVDCNTSTNLGRSSNYLQLKPGRIIKIVLRDGCNDPVVATNSNIPAFELLGTLVFSILIVCLARSLMQSIHVTK